jgi:predicted NBD/HSP70 family sugar kinase
LKSHAEPLPVKKSMSPASSKATAVVRDPSLEMAASGIARTINRDLVLNLIRTSEPIARVDISRRSGLQPSTVSQIVEQLLAEKWIVEGASAERPRGRRPTPLLLNSDLLILSVDLRPSQAIVAVMDLRNRLLAQEQIAIRTNPALGIEGLVRAIDQMRARFPGKSFEGIGMSVPGRVDPDRRRLIVSPNLKWSGVDVAGILEKRCGLQVEMENEANVCLIDALWSGKLEKHRNAVLVTISEGIGAAILMNGQMVCGKSGMAGEFGHVSIDPRGPECECGRKGCWEMFASSRATLRYYAKISRQSAPAHVTELLTLANAGNRSALKALRNQATQVGRGLQVIATALAPDLMIATVDVSLAWPEFASIVREELGAHMLAGEPPALTVVARSELTRLRGAAATVLQRHNGYHSYKYSGMPERAVVGRKSS